MYIFRKKTFFPDQEQSITVNYHRIYITKIAAPLYQLTGLKANKLKFEWFDGTAESYSRMAYVKEITAYSLISVSETLQLNVL